ncbi:J domain-containing protein [Rosettibacter firmus]|uniref:J domain-containing protein n=1 Tax=Rosettibacter firmus TaxID=3111522 RepID=UPI00336BE906
MSYKTNLIRMRNAADFLFEQKKYEDAYYIYDDIYHKIWYAIGYVYNGISSFSQQYLTTYKSNYELRTQFFNQAIETIFKKWFNLDIDQTLNEFIFATQGHLQCISYAPEINSTISSENVLNEYLILHTLILEIDNNWIDSILKIATPVFEENILKKIRPVNKLENVKKLLINNAEKIKSTDWFNVNIFFLDYLFNTGDNSSELFTSIHKIVGFYYNQKTHRKTTSQEQEQKKQKYTHHEFYEKYEKYERYELYEKKTIFYEDDFDPATATEFEKAKYYGKILGLSGRITKSQIRKKYLDLIAKYHPDRVSDLGEELKILAEKKTKQLNAAYEWMKKKYNL